MKQLALSKAKALPKGTCFTCPCWSCDQQAALTPFAANAVGNLKDSDLGEFFKKIAFKKERQTAINATARKIAVIIWNMITKKQAYNPTNNYLFLDQKRRIVSRMRKQIADLGLNPADLSLISPRRCFTKSS